MEAKSGTLGISRDVAHHLNKKRPLEGKDLTGVDNSNLRAWIADNPQQTGIILGYGVKFYTSPESTTSIEILDNLALCVYRVFKDDQLRFPMFLGGFKDGLEASDHHLGYQLDRLVKAQDYLSEAETVQ